MLKSFLFVYFIVSALQLSAQNDSVHVSGKIDTGGLKFIVIEKLGAVRLLGEYPIRKIPVRPDGTFSGNISIEVKGLYKVGDLFAGHKIFLRPGDSISIFMKKRPVTKYNTDYQMDAISPYPKNLSFFDEIDSGLVTPRFDSHFDSPEAYKKALTENYKSRLALLKTYANDKVLSSDFVPYAEAELKAVYIREAASLFSLLSKEVFSETYSKFPFEIDLNDSLMAVSTQFFESAAMINNIYFLNVYNSKLYYSSLKNQVQTLSQNYKGFVKELLLSNYLISFAGKNDPYFGEAYSLFLGNCKNADIKNYTRQKVELKLSKESKTKSLNNQSNLSVNEAFEKSFAEDASGKRMALKKILPSGKISVIDCWATWCVPCIFQIPFLKRIEDKYGDRVNFIFLSFDTKKESWLNYLQKDSVKHNNEFLIYDAFSSAFSRYFQIHSIPRYILVSKEGEILDNNLPLPSKELDFSKVLERFIDK